MLPPLTEFCFCSGELVRLSQPACLLLGRPSQYRCQRATWKVDDWETKDDHVKSWQFHQVWGFQEDDVCPEQFHSTTLLCSSLFCSKFRSLDRWEKVKASKKYSNPIFAVGRIIQCIGIGLGATTAAVFLTEVAIFLLLLNTSDNVWFLSSQRSQCFYFFSTLVAVFGFFSTWVKMWLYSKGNCIETVHRWAQ